MGILAILILIHRSTKAFHNSAVAFESQSSLIVKHLLSKEQCCREFAQILDNVL